MPTSLLTTTTTIEGVSSTGDPSIGGSNLKLAITAQQNYSEHFNDSFNNRGGGGGQSPPTPTVGKTLLNTSANLLPITTASDTFNNLKNLLKIDNNSTSPTSRNGGGHQRGGGGGLKDSGSSSHNGVYKRSPNSGEGRNSLNGRSGAPGASGPFSTGYSKNSAKIRQHDSEVSPRPRRSHQNDSSSSRYYNKNSDILGGPQPGGLGSNSNPNSGHTYNSAGGRNNGLVNNEGGRSYNSSLNQNELGGGNRRNYQQSSDGGYTRNINSGSGGTYRSHQGSRYENGNGNGQQRQYGSSTNAGYNNHYNNSNKSYGSSSRSANDGNLNNYNSSSNRSYNNRSDQRAGNNSGSNYRDYEDSPRGGGGGVGAAGERERERDFDRGSGGGRYINGNSTNGTSGGSNTNSLERRLPPSALRQNHLDRVNDRENNLNYGRSLNNRSPPVRGDNASGGSQASAIHQPSSAVNSSSSSRGISPNSPALTSASQHPTPAPTPPPAAGRWVPPSLRPQHGLSQAEKNDAVFRKVG